MKPRRTSGDGRRARAAQTRQRLVDATRTLLLTDELHPGIQLVTRAARCSSRSVHDIFGGLPGLYEAAVDEAVAEHIVSRLPVRSTRELALAFVLCRLPRAPA